MALPAKNAATAAKKPAATAAKKPAAAPKAEKVKKPGVGQFIKDQVLAGKDNPKILELVKAKFPDAKTSNASVNWYRSDLRGKGENVPSSRKPKAEKTAKKPAAKSAPKSSAKEESDGGFD